MKSPSNQLQTRVLIAYGLPQLGLHATSWVASLYLLKFATESLWIAPATVGAILGASRIWDAVSDPMIGHASDRTRSRFGRRRPWMFLGAPILAIAFASLWQGPGEPGTLLRTIWFALAIVGYYTAYTLVSVPHSSLGASLSRDTDERNQIFAARGAAQNLGLVVGLVALYSLERAESLEAAAAVVGIVCGGFAAISIMLGTGFSRELQSNVVSTPDATRAFREVAANRPARRVLGVLGLQEMALGALLVVLPFASDYVLRVPGQTVFYLLAFVVPLTASLPLWVSLGRRMGVRRAWRLGNTIEALGFLPIALAGVGDQLLVVFAAAVIGIGHGAGRVLAMTELANIADADAARTGRAKEGLYFAASTFVEKCAVGISVFSVGLALEASGFVAGVVPGELTVSLLRALASIFPASLLTTTCVMLSVEVRPREVCTLEQSKVST